MSDVVFQGVGKRFGSVVAVDTVDLAIQSGTLVTLLGPSGCGKTTTLRMIAGLEQPTSGQILIGGKDVTRLSPAERDVSMVFQSYALFPHLNVLDNVCYGLRSSGIKRRPAAEQAREAMAQVGLVGLESRMIGELSGGQQQRVALARAMVLRPKVLLFDEPLSNLDAKLRRHVRDEIRALQQALGLTVVYVTHDQAEALAISDRIVVMNNGRIAQDGSPRDLYERPNDRFVVTFMGEASIVPATATEDGAVLAGRPIPMDRRDVPIGPAELAIRPHAVQLRPQGGDGIPGSVVRATYAGDHMEYDVRLAGTETTVFAIDTHVATPLAIGADVSVHLDPTGLCLLPG